MRGSKSIVIIGGGVSGLVAAATVVKAGGFSVTLLEADNHIGGRVKSRKFGKNFVEFGAEWVHGEKDNRVFEVMEALEVFVNESDAGAIAGEPANHFESLLFATQNGEVMNTNFNQRLSQIFNAIYEDGEDVSDEKEESVTSLGDYAKEVFGKMNEDSPVHGRDTISDAALDFIHRYFNILDSADTWFQTSYGTSGDEFEYCEGNRLIGWKPPATFTSLLRVILGQSPKDTNQIVLPNWIQLGKEVTEIIYSTSDDSLVTISCKDESIYQADHVITTVSLGVLKEIHSTLFIPNLLTEKQAAIHSLGFGTANKIYLEYETSWWEDADEKFTGVGFLWENDAGEEVNANWLPESTEEELLKEHDGIPAWCRSLIGFNVVDKRPGVLQGWMSGVSSRFMETLDMDYVTECCVKVFNKFIQKEFDGIPKPINSARSTWYQNPFTRGSYSFRTVEAEENNAWAKDLAAPVLNLREKPILCFAGEATHDTYYSTTHGAYDTGVREANRIMEFYHRN